MNEDRLLGSNAAFTGELKTGFPLWHWYYLIFKDQTTLTAPWLYWRKSKIIHRKHFLFCIHFLNNSHVLFCVLNPLHLFLQNGDAKPDAEGFFSILLSSSKDDKQVLGQQDVSTGNTNCNKVNATVTLEKTVGLQVTLYCSTSWWCDHHQLAIFMPLKYLLALNTDTRTVTTHSQISPSKWLYSIKMPIKGQ